MQEFWHITGHIHVCSEEFDEINSTFKLPLLLKLPIVIVNKLDHELHSLIADI